VPTRTPQSDRPIIEAIAARAEPAAKLVTPLAEVHSLAVIPGAYNPPTNAHVALARAAATMPFDAVVFSLGTVTIDKPHSGLGLEERLYLLRQIVREEPCWGVVVHNRGLYAEQAHALRSAFPLLERLTFVVGMDKVGQIFDPRYYLDPSGSLRDLFANASLLVAARGSLDRAALAELLAQDVARPFAARVEWLELDCDVRDVAASDIRQRLSRGEHAGEGLPAAVTSYLRERGRVF